MRTKTIIANTIFALSFLSLGACLDDSETALEREVRLQEELDLLVEDSRVAESGQGAQGDIGGSVTDSESTTSSDYCDTLTHWKNHPQDFQGDSDLFGFMLDLGCEHCWGCAGYGQSLGAPSSFITVQDDMDSEEKMILAVNPVESTTEGGLDDYVGMQTPVQTETYCVLTFTCEAHGPMGTFHGDGCDASTRNEMAMIALDVCADEVQ